MIDTSDARDELRKAAEAIRAAQRMVDDVAQLTIADFSTKQLIQILEDRLKRELPEKRKLIGALWELQRAYAFENVVIEPQARISDFLTSFPVQQPASAADVADVALEPT